MSYQIKSTPFFQRIVATSKQSGELQKLKEEYDRIKIFNEKTLEVKVRQARLKRLFQDIEDIKETNIKKRRLTPNSISATTAASSQTSKLSASQDQRSKAKDLGQYYSNLNAARKGVNTISDLQYYRSKAFQGLVPKQKDNKVAASKEAKERINKRAAYGNRISNWNMHRMLMGKLRQEVNEGGKIIGKTNSTSGETSAAGKEKLKYRISYGNTISDLNMMMMPKRKSRCNLSQSSIQPPANAENVITPLISTLSEDTIRPISDSSIVPGQQQDYLVLDNGVVQPLFPCDPVALETRVKARRRWLKVPELLNDANSPGYLAKRVSDSEEEKQFQLRSISNDTNLLTPPMTPETCDKLDLSDNEEDYTQQERLYSSQNLSDTTQSSTATSYHSAITTEQMPAALTHKLKLMSRHRGNIDNVMKVYQPFARQMAEKEIGNSGVQELVYALEHKNN